MMRRTACSCRAAGDGVTAGQAEYIEPLASAAVAAGIDGLFVEVHDNPPRAKSDAQNALPLERVEPLLRHLMRLDRRRARLPSHDNRVRPHFHDFRK